MKKLVLNVMESYYLERNGVIEIERNGYTLAIEYNPNFNIEEEDNEFNPKYNIVVFCPYDKIVLK